MRYISHNVTIEAAAVAAVDVEAEVDEVAVEEEAEAVGATVIVSAPKKLRRRSLPPKVKNRRVKSANVQSSLMAALTLACVGRLFLLFRAPKK